jgi:hypothetical protein
MFCSEHKDELWDDTLTTNEWSHLEEVFRILKILEQTTLDVEGSFSSLGKVIMTMDFLLKLFEDITELKTELKYSDVIKSMANDA